MFIDTHTHIYSEEFDADREMAISRAGQAGVDCFLLPAIDSQYHERLLHTVSGFPHLCYPMMGLHPTSVKADFQNELAIVENYLERPDLRFYAVGEIGIDLYWDKTYEAEQKNAFRKQLNLAVTHHLPVVIHTRNSMDMALEILEKENNPGLRGVFHCFSGNQEQARRAINLGFLLGIGGVITYKNSGLQKVVEMTNPEHLVLETDAPWLPPVPHRGERNEPSYISLIAQKMAEIKKITLDQVAEITTQNARTIFHI